MTDAQEPLYSLEGVTLTTTRKRHIRRLNDLLYLSLERDDLPRARRAWSILTKCKEFNWKEHWRTGLLLVPMTEGRDAGKQKVEMLKKLMRFHSEEQEPILVEMVILLANDGLFREALDELDLYLPSLPYQDSSLLHTYAGMMALKLVTTPGKDMQAALDYFKRALVLDDENIVAKNCIEEIRKVKMQLDAVSEPYEEDEDAPSNEKELAERAKRLRIGSDF